MSALTKRPKQVDYAKLANESVRRRRAVKIPASLATSKHDAFFAKLREAGVALPETEAVFHPVRRWRFDYLWREQRVVLEVDGGVFAKGEDGQRGGRHNRGAGWVKDTEKLNAAAALGFRKLRCMPRQLTSAEMIETIRETLNWKAA